MKLRVVQRLENIIALQFYILFHFINVKSNVHGSHYTEYRLPEYVLRSLRNEYCIFNPIDLIEYSTHLIWSAFCYYITIIVIVNVIQPVSPYSTFSGQQHIQVFLHNLYCFTNDKSGSQSIGIQTYLSGSEFFYLSEFTPTPLGETRICREPSIVSLMPRIFIGYHQHMQFGIELHM